MANMSYCRFRNTLEDLHDCYENLTEVCGPEEEKARTKLLKLCQTIVADAEYCGLIEIPEVE